MPKEKSPAFQFYASDFLSDIKVQQMSMEEEGCYIHLMAICWREINLPSDSRVLQRCCKGAVPSDLVLSCFCEQDGVLIHPRLEAERKKQQEWREKSAKGGRRSAHKPKKQKAISTEQGGITTVEAARLKGGGTLQSSVFSLQSSVSNEEKTPYSPPKGNGPDPLFGFDIFYKSYPRHEAPKPARLAWAKIHADQELLDSILQWVEKAKLSDQWADKKMIPLPATFINRCLWEGDPPPAQKQDIPAPTPDWLYRTDDEGKLIS